MSRASGRARSDRLPVDPRRIRRRLSRLRPAAPAAAEAPVVVALTASSQYRAQRHVDADEGHAVRASEAAGGGVTDRAQFAVGLALAFLAGLAIGRSTNAASPPASYSPLGVDTGPTGMPPFTPHVESPVMRPGGGGVPSSPAAASEQPTPRVSVPDTTPTPAPTRRASGPSRPAQRPTAHSVTGVSSWYCLPGRSACTSGYPASGAYAAAGPALRVGAWRGRWVTVAANGRSVRVALRDWCQCPRRVIDLYASAFSRLVPLSRGVVTVRVTW